MNMKIKNEDILSKIEKLIVEGVNITKNAQESEAIYKIKNNDSVKFLAAVFHRYSVWKQKIKKLLNKEKIAKEIDIGILYEGNSVPDIRPGGIEYGDIQSEKSQELLRNIRIETSKKLDWLRQIKNKLSDKQKIDSKLNTEDKKVLTELQTQLIGNIRSEHTPNVYYHNKSGVGYADNTRFKFKNHQPEFFVFSEMYNNIGNPILRKKILELSSKSKNYKNLIGEDMITYFINDLSKKIRKRTKLNINQVVNNNGDLTLVAKKTETPPK